MSLWRQMTAGVRVLTRRSDVDRELADEIGHYVDEATAAFEARGLSPEAARRAARLEIGNLTVVREQVRDGGWENAVGTLLSDLRHGARRLRRNPGFAAVAILTLALGVGASTAIFSAVNPILFEPLPYPHAERIVTVSDTTSDGRPLDVTFGTFRELLQRNHVFESVAVFKPWQPTMIGAVEPERLGGQRVSASYFHTLGVTPVLGRDFQLSDDVAKGPNVVILSQSLWRRRFAGDPTIVGQQIKLDDNDYLVIGVMPSGFENVLAPLAECWAPLQYNTTFGPDSREWGHHLRMVARLSAGISMEQARRDLGAIAQAPVREFPRVLWATLSGGLITTSLQADVTRAVRPALLAVLGGVILLLAIACVNVTNLLLARGAQRTGELAVRAALGAGRRRLVRQLVTETMLLAVVGGALGIAVAEVGVRALAALRPPGLPRVDAIRVNGAVLAFGTIVTTMIGLLVGIVPALHAARGNLQVGLQQGTSRTASAHHTTRRVLVVAEIALALVLLVGAGLLFRSVERVFGVALGFDASHLLTMQVQEAGRRYQATEARSRFYAEALEAVRGVPGVADAAFTSLLPLSGDVDIYGVHFEADGNPKDDGAALRYAVTPGYFDVMRIPLRRGRLLDAHDGRAGAPRAVLINESFASRRFPRQAAIGQRLHFGADDGQWYTIVGVVGDVKQSVLALNAPDAIYLPWTQWHWADTVMSLVVRGRGDAAALTNSIRTAIWSVDKDQPIVRVATVDTLVSESVADRRFALVLFEAFGIAALALAAIGIYGVLSGSVAERTREIGVRAALGAARSDIVSLIVRQGLTVAALGIAIGLSGAVAVSGAIGSLLFGVSRLDPLTYAGVVTLLACVSATACGFPAWRAARIDPSITLRGE